MNHHILARLRTTPAGSHVRLVQPRCRPLCAPLPAVCGRQQLPTPRHCRRHLSIPHSPEATQPASTPSDAAPSPSALSNVRVPVPAPSSAAQPSPAASSRGFMSDTPLQRVLLIRHAESLGNTGEQSAQLMGDHNLTLSPLGQQQARQLGQRLTRDFFLPADPSTAPPLLYMSPYKRTRQTMSAVLAGAGVSPDEVDVREDVRLREVEFGYDTDRAGDIPLDQQEELRRTHGWFFYRFRGGESPADCYDRMSSFLASLHRQLLRTPSQSVLVLSHGLALRCLLMRWLRLSVEQFDALDNPTNCQRIELLRGGGKRSDAVGQWLLRGSAGGRAGPDGERLWGVRGVRLREEAGDWKKEEMREAAGADSNEKASKNSDGKR